jgi:hypothetical protein
MINPTDLLLRGNYVIFYNYDHGTSYSTVGFSRDPGGELTLTYVDGKFKVHKDNQVIEYTISSEAIYTFIQCFIRAYADSLDYPLDYIVYLVDKNRTSQVYYAAQPNLDHDKRDLFFSIYEEIYADGLNKSHIDLCVENDMFDDLKELCQFMLGIQIEAV